MKKVVLLLGLAILQACADRETETIPPEVNSTGFDSSREAAGGISLVDAWLGNELLVDGCDLHFRIGDGVNSKFLVASEGSLRKVAEYFQQENRGQASIPVKITYVPTGKTRKIRCGWGKEVEYPAVDVIVITKP